MPQTGVPATSMREAMVTTVEHHASARPTAFTPLGGGCVGDVYRVDFADRASLVAKIGDPGSGLAIEGGMLKYLATHTTLPVPDTLHAEDELLLMTWIDGGESIDDDAQVHAAELLAGLHGVTASKFGFDGPTRIGGLVQSNPWSGCWVDFFRDQRLLDMGRQAVDARRLPGRLMDRLENLAARLGDWIGEPPAPALLHGDMWNGNILCKNGRVTGVIDPAIYYGDPEIELAFGTLFGTFGKPFFERYGDLRPLQAGFFEERRDLYNLYPLLVHVRLFGGPYVGSVETALKRFGC